MQTSDTKRPSHVEGVKEYDKSSHSTQVPQQDDLNAPGQSGGKARVAPAMSEVPGKTPKHRG